MRQAMFVYRLKQAWPKLLMHFERRIDDNSSDRVQIFRLLSHLDVLGALGGKLFLLTKPPAV
jgi:hypothetical protein